MKTTLIAFIGLLFFTSAFAQSAKVDDALLLEYYQAQRYQDAANYLKKAFPEPISDVKVLSRLAYTTQLAKKLPEAEAYYQRIYNIDTTNQAALFSIGNINLQRGAQQKAAMYFLQILKTDTTNISVYTKLASIAADRKDTIATVYYLKKANTLNAFDIDVAVDLGTLYIKTSKFDKALAVLNKAAESDPENVFLLQTMVDLLYKEKKYKETIETGKKLITLDAADKDVMYKMGVSYYSVGNFICGAEILSGFSNNDQTEYSDYFAGLCFKGLKDYNASAFWMGKAIEQSISGNVASYYGEIADSNEKLFKAKKALQAYQKALQFDDANPQIYYAMALLYDKQLKDKLNAKVYYKKAAAAYVEETKRTENPMDLYSLASLYDTNLKDTANAIKFYKKYLDSKPPQKQQTYITYTQGRIGQLGGGAN